MNRLILVLAAAFALGGCIIDDGDDGAATCKNFDYFLGKCAPECTVTWSCESNYYSLDIDTQLDLDECSDCLAGPGCGDCSTRNVGSCWAFMEDFLDVDCW